MDAIGASSTGAGRPARRARDCWNVSAQRTSGVSRITWRRFQAMPMASTQAISALSSGLRLERGDQGGGQDHRDHGDRQQEDQPCG